MQKARPKVNHPEEKLIASACPFSHAIASGQARNYTGSMDCSVVLIPAERYNSLKASGKLPSPRGVAFAIIKLMQREKYPVDDLVKLVQSDPAIAGCLLKFANAAIVGQGRPVVSLRKAILALGAFRVRDLVVGFSILQSNRSGLCRNFDYESFWAHSLATAIACQGLAQFANIASDEHFTVGLLSRIGELGLASLFPMEYSALLAEGPSRAQLGRREAARFGFDHRQLGATMMDEWGLPHILIEAAYHHEDPAAAHLSASTRLSTLTLSLDFARAQAEICMASEEKRWSLLPDLLTRSAHLGIGAESLSSIVDDMVVHWHEWSAMLQVRTRDVPPFSELLTASPPRPAHANGNGEPCIALIGPDNEETRTLAGLLGNLGHLPQFTLYAQDAIPVLPSPPRLIIADIDATEGNVAALCHSLRQSPAGSEPYILVIASPEYEAAALSAIDSGADDVLIKPVSAQNLRLRLSIAERLLLLREGIARERRGIVRSTEEFAGEHRHLIEEALTDPLTELPNRRHGLDYLATEWSSSHAGQRQMACLMLDIDHFKQINDSWGHVAGDALLQQLANRLKSASRSEDMLFRFGGEEFVLILSGANLALALSIAERIRHLVADEAFIFQGHQLHATVSIGLATASGEHGGADSLIQAADAALYRAKQQGRNCVVVAA